MSVKSRLEAVWLADIGPKAVTRYTWYIVSKRVAGWSALGLVAVTYPASQLPGDNGQILLYAIGGFIFAWLASILIWQWLATRAALEFKGLDPGLARSVDIRNREKFRRNVQEIKDALGGDDETDTHSRPAPATPPIA